MSKFNALNLTPQEELLEAEEHSRELQVEESFKIFQSALFYLKNKRFKDAGVKFEELFNVDVIKPDSWGLYRYSSPTLDSLRYLAYRNRGMYYYSYLMENHTTMESADIVNYILKVVEDLTESIQHSDADNSVTGLLVEIFQGFKTRKLERLVLEYELTRQDNQLLLLGRRQKVGMLPQLNRVIQQYQNLLKGVRDDKTLQNMYIMKMFQQHDEIASKQDINELNEVLANIQKMKTQDEETMRQLDVFELTIKDVSWSSVAQSLKGMIPHLKTTALLAKDSDPYSDAEYPIECVQILINEDEMEADVEHATVDTETTAPETEPISQSQIPSDIVNGQAKNDSLPINTDLNLQVEQLTKKRSNESTDVQRPAQRSSKRFRVEQEVDEKEIFEIHTVFFTELANSLSVLNHSIPLDFVQFSSNVMSYDTEYLAFNDFFNCLRTWNSRHTDIFTQSNHHSLSPSSNDSKDKDESLQLTTLLKSNVSDEYGEKENYYRKLSDLPKEPLEGFINDINSKKMHFQEVRFKLLEHLLSIKSADSTIRLIIDYVWPTSLYSTVEWLLVSVESAMFDFLSNDFENNKYLGLSIFECLVNLLGSIADDIKTKKLQGSKFNELRTQKNKIDFKVKNWMAMLEQNETNDTNWQVYFKWARYCYFQYSTDSVDNTLINLLTTIDEDLKVLDKDFDVVYPNYKYIPHLNLEIIHSQIKKIGIIQRLTIVDLDDLNGINPDMDSHISLLERILLQAIDTEEELITEDKDMVSFIRNSPFLLQVKLWDVLFSYYCDKNDQKKVMKCYIFILKLLMGKLSSIEYSEQSEQGRQQMLLTCLSTIGHFSSKLIKILSKNLWDSETVEVNKDGMEILISTFFMFYTVLFFETSVNVDSSLKSYFQRANKSAGKMKDIISNISTVILYLFNMENANKVFDQAAILTTNFVWNFHALLGHFKFCDSANGNFLRLSENLLCHYINEETYAQLKQVLWCRYHYSTTSDNFSPDNHFTKAMTMDKINALPLGIYLIKLQYSDKNPLLVAVNKSTLKPVLDNIIDTIGNPSSTEDFIITRNKYLLKEYIETPITTKLIKSSLWGKNRLLLASPNDELQLAMDTGLFYVSSVQAMHQYRIRKKSMQARPSELDSIIVTLKGDIKYNTERFESWYLLGKCYSYIVEDELIWTSDKITIPEKKRITANNQRKAIVCYLMALSIYYKIEVPNEDQQKILIRMLEALGAELISGYYKPMDKLCFTWNYNKKFLKYTPDGEVLEDTPVDAVCISDFNIEQTILLCYNRANESRRSLKLNGSDLGESWMNYYHVGHVLFKCNKETMTSSILFNILEACSIAIKMSSPKDLIVEPHYYIIDMCYKLVKQSILTVETAFNFLKRDNGFFEMNESFWSLDYLAKEDCQKKSFHEKLIVLLCSTGR